MIIFYVKFWAMVHLINLRFTKTESWGHAVGNVE